MTGVLLAGRDAPQRSAWYARRCARNGSMDDVSTAEAKMIPPGTAATREQFRPIDLFQLVTLSLVLIALVVLFGQNRATQAEQHASEQRGYKNRAVICDMVAGLGLHPSRECTDPRVVVYRDKTAATTGTTGARNSRATLTAVCHLAEHLRVTVPECDPAG